MSELTKQHIVTIKDAARKLTGVKRRAFQAQRMNLAGCAGTFGAGGVPGEAGGWTWAA